MEYYLSKQSGEKQCFKGNFGN
uniref:Uncharacterized protein n=1 Tax=Vitis vinifera TaxID=29760 RepID=F6I2T4_VITVI